MNISNKDDKFLSQISNVSYLIKITYLVNWLRQMDFLHGIKVLAKHWKIVFFSTANDPRLPP